MGYKKHPWSKECGKQAVKTACPARNFDNSDKYYDEEETEVLKAVEAFKREHSIRFPTVTEIFHVIKKLGYRK